jgi:hypothetical protein
MSATSLLSNSARATTAEESRFRLDYPLAPARAVRVVALDRAAEEMVRRVAALPWDTARFLIAADSAPVGDGVSNSTGDKAGLGLRGLDGTATSLDLELVDVDVVIMVATTGSAAAAAATIGAACSARTIMTAGIVLGNDWTQATVAVLRPFARVLMVSADEGDLTALLTAVRA